MLAGFHRVFMYTIFTIQFIAEIGLIKIEPCHSGFNPYKYSDSINWSQLAALYQLIGSQGVIALNDMLVLYLGLLS